MLVWLKDNRWRVLLHLLAIFALLDIAWQAAGPFGSVRFDPVFELAGRWAIRFLLLCLAMTPLNTYLGWRTAISLRKPAGLWAFGFGVLHFTSYLTRSQDALSALVDRWYVLLGLGGLLILSALAITSNRWAMRRLRHNWKRLHRLVYIAGLAVSSHAVLAFSFSKRGSIYPEAVVELQVYLVMLVILLALRIPTVKRALLRTMRRPALQN
ncbi:MAG: ferric reductase-like transmembrane domain-containing protein [Anaerolineae bacterium]|nr:ferric reductase-like transmembrane domain-containing protein [Anaerolineae bacterium]